LILQVDGNTISSIGAGLLCLVGVGKDDGEEDAEYMCDRSSPKAHVILFLAPLVHYIQP
jgi:D-Tyr-tRNAtyr deacylase